MNICDSAPRERGGGLLGSLTDQTNNDQNHFQLLSNSIPLDAQRHIGEGDYPNENLRRYQSQCRETAGELLSFANDFALAYCNNHGTLRLTIIRLS